MRKELVKETKFGKATARVTVSFFTTFNTDLQAENAEPTQCVTVDIVAGGKVRTSGSFADRIYDCETSRSMMEKAGMDLSKEYTRVGKAITEGRETYDEIMKMIEEMKEELSEAFGVKSDRQKKVEEAQEVIKEAEKEGIESLMTAKEIKSWKQRYNAVNNEGGEGYIPFKLSREVYHEAVEYLSQQNE